MASYLSENGLKIYKMETSILLKFLTLKWDISRTIWRIEVSDGSFFFFIFHTLSFEINFVCDRSFPSILNISNFSKYVNGICTQLHYLEATSIETAIVLYAIMSIFGSNQNIIGQVVSQYKYG